MKGGPYFDALLNQPLGHFLLLACGLQSCCMEMDSLGITKYFFSPEATCHNSFCEIKKKTHTLLHNCYILQPKEEYCMCVPLVYGTRALTFRCKVIHNLPLHRLVRIILIAVLGNYPSYATNVLLFSWNGDYVCVMCDGQAWSFATIGIALELQEGKNFGVCSKLTFNLPSMAKEQVSATFIDLYSSATQLNCVNVLLKQT